MTHQPTRIARNKWRTLASLLALAVMASRSEAFQAPRIAPRTNVPINPLSTRLLALAVRPKSPTAAFYSNTADPPLSDLESTKGLSFGNRMRNLVLRRQEDEQQQRKKSRSNSLINPHKPSFVEEAVSLSSFKELVADEPERLVVVRFYAKWCKACKAAEPHFYRLAHSLPDVKFVEVPVLEENANLHQGLGVPVLPYAHIYSPAAGLVEELKMTKKGFKNFQRIVHTYRDGQCSDLELDPETGTFSDPFAAKDETASVEQML